MRKLIFVGSDVNALDVRGDTPLTVSAGSGHLDVVRLLVDNGADLLSTSKDLQRLCVQRSLATKKSSSILTNVQTWVYNRFEFFEVYRRRLVKLSLKVKTNQNELSSVNENGYQFCARISYECSL